MQSRHRTRSIVGTSLIAAVLALTNLSFGSPSMVAHAVTVGLGAGGEYHPLTPDRIYDTRNPLINTPVEPIATSPAGGLATVHVLGEGGVPNNATDVLAVVINITVASPSKAGYLQAYPAGSAAGVSSVVNFVAGQTVPNLMVVTLGTGGDITLKLSTVGVGTADVLVDVFGWFSTSSYGTNGARLIAVGPARIWDTRENGFYGNGQPIGQGQTLLVPIRGADSRLPSVTDIVPNDPNVVGVILNVTGINTEPNNLDTFISVLPENPVGPVTTSNLNLARNQVKANLVIVPVTNADGAIRIFNNSAKVHVAVDVVGYMRANESDAVHPRAGRVIPLVAPFRAFDTRDPAFGNAQLGPNQAEAWSFSQFVSSVTLDGQSVGNQGALLGNLTGTGLTRVSPYFAVSTFFTVYPGDVQRPFSSNINVTEGVNVPNMAVIKLGANGEIRAFNNSGYIHYLFDVSAVVLAD